MLTYKSILTKSAIFLATFLLFIWGIGSQEIIGFNSRFYLFAREMQQFGWSWFPTTYQQPYPDYLATSTWLITLVAKLLGGLNKITAVLPTAVMGALTVTLTYSIGALRDRRWGWYAACLLLLTIPFLKSGRGIALDMYTTAISTAVFYLLASAKPKQSRNLWIFTLLFISFAFRGPIGLIIPAGVACVYYLLAGKYKKFFMFGLGALLLLCVCSIILLLLAYETGGLAFMQRVLTMEVIGRLNNYYVAHYFYFINSFAAYALGYSLACLSIAGITYYAIKNHHLGREGNFLIQLLGWLLVIIVGMSIPDDKKIRYIMPIVPAAALIAAYIFIAPRGQKYFRWLRTLVLSCLALLPLLCLAICIFNPARFDAPSFQGINLTNVKLFMSAMQLMIVILLCLPQKDHAACILGAAVFYFAAINYLVIEPSELYLDRARDFVLHIETQRQKQHAQLVFYRENPDGMPIKYVMNMPNLANPVFINTQQELSQIHRPTYIVTSIENFSPQNFAQYHIIGRDSLGHVRVMVLSNIKD